jgi:hypothetical protein
VSDMPEWISNAIDAGVISEEEGKKIRGFDPVNFGLARELLDTQAICTLAVLKREASHEGT